MVQKMDRVETSISKVGGYTGRRMLKDALFRRVMTFGGLSVIIAISAIFFYLASVVVPIFMPPKMDEFKSLPLPPAQSDVVHLSAEEQAEVGVRMQANGMVDFFDLRDGKAMGEVRVAVPQDTRITSFAAGDPSQRAVAYGLDDGRMILLLQDFKTTFTPDPNDPTKDIRTITPSLQYPLGEAPLPVDEEGKPLKLLTVQHGEEGTTAVAFTEDGRLVMTSFSSREDMITGEVTAERESIQLPLPPEGEIRQLILDVKQSDLYVLHGERRISHYDVMDKSSPRLVQTVQVAPEGERVTAMTILSGGFSLIIGTDKGNISQWFNVRDADNNRHLTHIRAFKPMTSPVTTLAPEHYRKGFLAGGANGDLALYYATSRRHLITRSTGSKPVLVASFAPRANAVLASNADGKVQVTRVENPHPEVSFHALWQKVWYESYDKPDYIWQSSSAASDFEPKFSLAPLTFGTLKAAFYAMLIAVPLAVLGAIYTAYFMSPRMRQVVKPSIEIMEALPTVILGFLAGLWLAPYVDNNLPGTLLAILLLPFSFVITARLWRLLPQKITQRLRPGWEAALLIPVVIAVIWLAISLGRPIEAAFFGGNMPHWITTELGWTYEQRNSLVVGIAMGFAVIPTIYSIAEDAVFSVPKYLASSSLALGATPWQTLVNVVLLTASPGIFSAIMIGLGRAVGETMIVLMATGNTAVMDLSIFTGFRALSANIGVEMSEAAVGTTHYRLLFFSALVLFAFTFVVNTLAELVRQRLREKYSTL